jgi:hypothetical protein
LAEKGKLRLMPLPFGMQVQNAPLQRPLQGFLSRLSPTSKYLVVDLARDMDPTENAVEPRQAVNLS